MSGDLLRDIGKKENVQSRESFLISIYVDNSVLPKKGEKR